MWRNDGRPDNPSTSRDVEEWPASMQASDDWGSTDLQYREKYPDRAVRNAHKKKGDKDLMISQVLNPDEFPSLNEQSYITRKPTLAAWSEAPSNWAVQEVQDNACENSVDESQYLPPPRPPYIPITVERKPEEERFSNARLLDKIAPFTIQSLRDLLCIPDGVRNFRGLVLESPITDIDTVGWPERQQRKSDPSILPDFDAALAKELNDDLFLLSTFHRLDIALGPKVKERLLKKYSFVPPSRRLEILNEKKRAVAIIEYEKMKEEEGRRKEDMKGKTEDNIERKDVSTEKELDVKKGNNSGDSAFSLNCNSSYTQQVIRGCRSDTSRLEPPLYQFVRGGAFDNLNGRERDEPEAYKDVMATYKSLQQNHLSAVQAFMNGHDDGRKASSSRSDNSKYGSRPNYSTSQREGSGKESGVHNENGSSCLFYDGVSKDRGDRRRRRRNYCPKREGYGEDHWSDNGEKRSECRQDNGTEWAEDHYERDGRRCDDSRWKSEEELGRSDFEKKRRIHEDVKRGEYEEKRMREMEEQKRREEEEAKKQLEEKLKKEEEVKKEKFIKSKEVHELPLVDLLSCLDECPVKSMVAVKDPFHQVQLSTFDSGNYKGSIEELKKAIELDKMIASSSRATAKVNYADTQITLVLGAGGLAVDISFEDRDVIVNGSYHEAAPFHRQDPSVQLHSFSSTDLPPSCKGFESMLRFPTRIMAEKALKQHEGKLKKRPRCILFGSWNEKPLNRSCGMELTWESLPPTHFTFDPPFDCDEEYIDKIVTTLSSSGAQVERWNGRHGAQCTLAVRVQRNMYTVENEKENLEKLLEVNKIERGRGMHVRRKGIKQIIDTPEQQAKCIFAINRKLVLCAMEVNMWRGFRPQSEEEWQMFLSSTPFPWKVTIKEVMDTVYRGSSDRYAKNVATIQFEDMDLGEYISIRLQASTPDYSVFSLNKTDEKGVFVRSFYSQSYVFPRILKQFMKEELDVLQQDLNINSYFSRTNPAVDNQWARLSESEGDKEVEVTAEEFVLKVEGFPPRFVRTTCHRLLALLRGRRLDCSEEGMKWLLTGFGRNLADSVAKKALDLEVLIDFCVVGEEITLFGGQNVDRVEKELRTIAKNRNDHIVTMDISLGLPSYLDRLANGMNWMTLDKVDKYIGGDCKLTVSDEDGYRRTVRFDGSIGSLEKCKEFFERIDNKMRDYARENIKSKPGYDPNVNKELSVLECPICLLRVSYDFYCLDTCGHYYCTQCLAYQISSEIKSRSLPLKCAYDGCEMKMGIEDILRMILDDRSIRLCNDSIQPTASPLRLRPFEMRKLQKLVDAAVDRALLANSHRLVPCGTIDCNGIFERKVDKRKEKTFFPPPGFEYATPPPGMTELCVQKGKSGLLTEVGLEVTHTFSDLKPKYDDKETCGTCGREACSLCGYEIHQLYSCAEYAKMRENPDESIAAYRKLRPTNVKGCPKCNATIEKEVGCNHMECLMCRTHFCWVCGFTTNKMGEVYAHLQKVHGGNGLMPGMQQLGQGLAPDFVDFDDVPIEFLLLEDQLQ